MTQANTADDILACARQLILAGGYNGFSYADIAAVVGIRKPSIHHHFPAKADLVRILVSRYREEARAGLKSLETRVADPLERLRLYTHYWASCLREQKEDFCVCARLASDLPQLPEAVAAEVTAHFRTLSAWLTSALEQGRQRGQIQFEGVAADTAEVFMATVHGAMLSARAYGNSDLFGVIVSSLLERLVARD